MNRRHQLLLAMQTKIAALLFAVLTVVGTVAGGTQAIQHHQHQQAVATAQARAHFWKVVAGTEQPTSATVDNTLASDLHARMGPSVIIDDPNSFNRLSQRVEDFRGDSNSYGGITDAIGYDPFADESLPCKECGPLDAQTKHNLLLIQQGNLKVVLAKDIPHFSSKYTLTPGGMGVIPFAGLVWLMGGPLTLAAAHRRLMFKDRMNQDRSLKYGIRQFADLSWSMNGENDGAKLALMAMSPSFFIPFTAWRAANKRRFEKKMRNSYGSEMDMVRAVDNTLAKVSLRHGDDPKVQALQKTRETLVDEIQSLTRSSQDGSMDALVARTERQLKDIQESLAVRKDSLEEAQAQSPIFGNALPETRPRTRRR